MSSRKNVNILLTLVSIGVVVYLLHGYIYRSLESVVKLGNIGCFLSGVGLLFLGLQYFSQNKSIEISQENERLVRMWNTTNFIDDVLSRYTVYKNNCQKISKLNLQIPGSGYAVELRDKVYDLEQENNLHIHFIGNKMASLEILLKDNYAQIRAFDGTEIILKELSDRLRQEAQDTSSCEFILKCIIEAKPTTAMGDGSPA